MSSSGLTVIVLLSPPAYTGPYKVLQRRPKAFLLDVRGVNDWVFVDRLKVAHLDSDPPPIRRS